MGTDLLVTDSVVVKLDIARIALAEAKTIQETKKIFDIASAAEIYAKRQQLGEEAIKYATAIKVEALAQLGRMLRETPRNEGGNIETLKYASTSTKSAPVDEPPTLADLGLDKKTSKLAQDIAELPEEQLEKVKSGIITLNKAQRNLQENKRFDSRKQTTLPDGIYNVIYADPPWQYNNTGVDGAAIRHYPTMSTRDICNINIPSDKNAVLFLWVTNPFLQDAFDVLKAWGFSYKTNIVWVKTDLVKPGAGFYVRGRHELIFICIKGSFAPNMRNKAPIGSVLFAPIQDHSKKPKQVYEFIENLYPDSKYLELFARETREGWMSWGNEIKEN